MRILVTGYAGFIGSNLSRMLLEQAKDDDKILGIDCHTYAARPKWIWDHPGTAKFFNHEDVDIRNFEHLRFVVEQFNPDVVYHLAAESHVCKSIEGPSDFATTNFMGTFNLLEVLRRMNFKGRMVHISTDEAFGELRHGDEPFDEQTAINPTSPYSASKAASDLMVRAYAHTYKMNLMITRCTNNFGPNQHLEKLIPKAIDAIMNGTTMTMYGDGTHSRDWIFVDDHCRALMKVAERGSAGQLYCIGSGHELSNMQVVDQIYQCVKTIIDPKANLDIKFTNDRPTDDMRYAVHIDKMNRLGWAINPSPEYFSSKLAHTIKWYMEHQE